MRSPTRLQDCRTSFCEEDVFVRRSYFARGECSRGSEPIFFRHPPAVLELCDVVNTASGGRHCSQQKVSLLYAVSEAV
jgi:hypothetical protein